MLLRPVPVPCMWRLMRYWEKDFTKQNGRVLATTGASASDVLSHAD